MMFRRIVVGLDFLSPSLAAARFAVRRFRPAEVLFVHVLPDWNTGSNDPLTTARDAQARMREIAYALDVANPDFDVVSGVVANELCAIAQDVDADLLCIGAPSRMGESAPFTTARAIVRRTLVNALVVPVSARVGPVYGAWAGPANGPVVLRVGAAVADEWGKNLNAFCFLGEDQRSSSDPDGVEQRSLAQILQQAELAGAETAWVDVHRNVLKTHDRLLSFAEAQRGGLVVCDAELARIVLDEDAVAQATGSRRPLIDQLPLLTVVDSRSAGGPTTPRRDGARPVKSPFPPDGGSAA